MSQEQFNLLIEKNIMALVRAASEFQDNPEKSKEYIRKRIHSLAEGCVMYGEQKVVNSLFD